MKGKELRTVIPTRSKAGLQMPIQSTCVRCGQKLSVGSRQAGEEATCLQCGETQKIPTGPPPHDQPAEQHEDAGLPEDPYAEFAVHDDAEWVYEDEPSRERRQLQPVVRDLVAVPRRVIYLQGLLLGAVAVVSFSIGILVAGRGADPEAAVDRLPCLVSGVLSYRSASGLELPDSGAVVIALPVDRRPGSNERAAIVGLRPDDPVPKPSHESLQTIRALGGGYIRSDQAGAYELRLSSAGDYYFLFLSANAARPPSEQLDKRHLAQLGRYFRRVVELLGDRRYEWQEIAVRRDRSIDLTF